LIGIGCAIILPLLAGAVALRDPAICVSALVVAVILGSIFGVAGWAYPKLRVYPQGISRHDIGYTLSTTWGNVEALWEDPATAGLVLRYPMETRAAFRFANAAEAASFRGLPFYPPEALSLIRERRFIPLEVFSYWFRKGDLLHEIRRHAPALGVALIETSEREP